MPKMDQRGWEIASLRNKVDLLTALQVACLVTCWAILCWSSSRTFGLGLDEGYYLISASDPYKVPYNVTQSGFIWHPLYLLVGGDIALFRTVGTLVLEFFAIVFGFALARFLRPRLNNSHEFSYVVLALGTTVWFLFGWGDGIAPSYTGLNLCGLLLFMSGLLEAVTRSRDANNRSPLRMVMSAILAGMGLALIACAKPPTAVFAVILGLAWLGWMPIRHRLLILLATAVITLSLCASVAVYISGNVVSFLRTTWVASALATNLYNNLGIARPGFNITLLPSYPDLLVKISLVTGVFVTQSVLMFIWTGPTFHTSHTRVVWRNIVLYGGAVGFFAWMAYSRATAWAKHSGPEHGFIYALQFLFAVLFFCVAVRNLRSKDGERLRSEPTVYLVSAVLMGLPFIAAVGSGGWIIYRMQSLIVFWCAAVLCMATCAPRSARSSVLAASAAFCSMITLAFFIGFIANPFSGRPPMWKQNEPIELGPKRSVLRVDTDTRLYLETLIRAARSHGFKVGDSLFNFSSRGGPGVAFALGASTPGTAFMGYSIAAAPAYIATVPEKEIRKAWVLLDDDKLKAAAGLPWQSYGLRFPEDYERIVGTALGGSGTMTALWKPRAGIP